MPTFLLCSSLQALRIKDERGALDRQRISDRTVQTRLDLGQGAIFCLILGHGPVGGPGDRSCQEQGGFSLGASIFLQCGAKF